MNDARPLILVVEDDTDMRELMGIVLQGMDLEAKLAETADEALAMCRDNPGLRVVLLDLGLPGMRPEDFIESARRLQVGVSMKFILASGRDNLAQEARRLGACDFIKKPFNLSELENAVDKALED